MVKRIKPFAFAFILGAVLYTALEILWRGWSHWSMTVTGGACLAGLYGLKLGMKRKPRLFFCILGGLLITTAEFVAGCIVNMLLGWDVWDYSRVKGNLWGQVCLPYTVLWIMLALPAGYLCDRIQGYFSDNNR